MKIWKFLPLCAALVVLGSTGAASAAPTNYPTCNDGYTVKMVHNSVHVPTYFTNAQRGDVVLTAGGEEIPQRMLSTLGQTYNHALIISQADNGQGHTTFTHDTAISIGVKSTTVGVVYPAVLRRTPPGNAVGDTADRLLNGHYRSCNNDHPMSYCHQQGARPVNLWRGTTKLLRPSASVFGSVNIADMAELAPAYSIPYAVSAYSVYQDALNATGNEAPFGVGTMCSGFVADAVNKALAAAGRSYTVPLTFYTQPQRISAAQALYNKLTGDGAPAWTAHQVVSCFAWGGDCVGDPTDQFAILAPGTGLTISPDNLRDSSTSQTPWWSTMLTADFAGGYSINRFSHYECCNEAGNCYRPEVGATATPVRGLYTAALLGDDNPPPPGMTPKDVTIEQERREWFNFAISQPGQWAESEEELCWVADSAEVGRVCTPLEGLEVAPEFADVPTETVEDEQPANFGQAVKTLKSGSGNSATPGANPGSKNPGSNSVAAYTPAGGPKPGTLTSESSTTTGEPTDIELMDDLIFDLGPDSPNEITACLGQTFVAYAALTTDGSDAVVHIDGRAGTAVAVRPTVAGAFTLAALAVSPKAGVAQSLRRTVNVVSCEPKGNGNGKGKGKGNGKGNKAAAPRVDVVAERLTTEADAFRFTAAVMPAPTSASYTWYFGDGAVAKTTEPTVDYSYALRKQDGEAVNYLVTVEVETGSGAGTGYANAPLVNPAWTIAKDTGRYELPVAHEPTPSWGVAGLGVDLRIRNIASDGVATFSKASVVATPCSAKGKAQSFAWNIDEVAVLKGIEPGGEQAASLYLPVPWQKEAVCRWDVTLTGLVGKAPATARATFETGLREGVEAPVYRHEAEAALRQLVEAAQK